MVPPPPPTGFTVTVIAAEPCKPPLSVTEAVIVCVPPDRVFVENDPPEPMLPSRLEVHARLAVRSPSSSVAVPVNVMGSPWVNVDPFAGAVIVTVGGAFPKDGNEKTYILPSFSLGSELLSTARSTMYSLSLPPLTLGT